MNRKHILWADDEIDLLKPHIIFLENKGYRVTTVNNGHDAIEITAGEKFDLIILDENMPGISGLEALTEIKQNSPGVPVVMITKSEEENIMDQAVGKKIADYLIKPVNPKQILMSIKKLLHSDRLISETTGRDYRLDFMNISNSISSCATLDQWKELYRRIVSWEIELSQTDTKMDEMLAMQKNEANAEFFKFVRRNYQDWINDTSDTRPLLSPDIFKKRVFPILDRGEKLFFILIDNFRLDQWETVKPLISEFFLVNEELYTSILPTATQYARNAIFSGFMPRQIEKMFPTLWIDEDSENSKNLNESPLVETQMKRFHQRRKFSYNKLMDSADCEKLVGDFTNLTVNELNVVVVNFIDMLSHAGTESKMIRELASSDAAYRSLTLSWFRHSPIMEFLRKVAESGYKAIITTDHGTIRVDNPVKVIGDRNTNTNLRYKVGRALNYNQRQVYDITRPENIGLPSPNISSTYIFAGNHDFFAYPNNYNHYVQYYTDTFQHGGISLEEMIVPFITLSPK